jgi:hypothetical protein
MIVLIWTLQLKRKNKDTIKDNDTDKERLWERIQKELMRRRIQ